MYVQSINNHGNINYCGITPPKTNPKYGVSELGKNLLLGSLLALASIAPIKSNATTYNDNFQKKEIKNLTPQTENDNKLKAQGLKKTSNPNIYYNEKEKAYFCWDKEKKEYKKDKKIAKVYKTGYIETKKGEFLTPDGKSYIVKDLGKYLIPIGGRFDDLGKALAVVNGYKISDIARDLKTYSITNHQELEVYYNEDTKKYLRWNNDSQEFEISPVTEVIGEYYSINNDRFKIEYSGRESKVTKATEEEYQANKNDLSHIKNNIYESNDDNKIGIYYAWDNKTNTFKEFGYKIDVNNMLTQKSNGEIRDFYQGDMGDCWLLAPINGMLHHPNPVLREKFTNELNKCWSVNDNDDITITLRGVNKKYTFTKEDIDSVLTKSNHYSVGERKIVAIEMAMEKYLRTLQNKGINRKHYTNIYNMNIPPLSDDPDYALDGGNSHNAIHILTGKEAHVIQQTYYDDVICIDNKYVKGFIDENFLLNKLKNNMVLVSYHDLADKEYHVVSLQGIDEDTVYVIDSNIDELEPDKKNMAVAIPKPKFFSELKDVIYTNLSTNINPQKTKAINAKYEPSDEVRKMYPDIKF